MPSISHSVTLDICPRKQQRFLTHSAGAFKTVAAIGHAAKPTVFGATTTTGRFQSGIDHIVVNKVFHLADSLLFVADAVQACGGSVLSLPLVYLSVGIVDTGALALCDVVPCRTSSL